MKRLPPASCAHTPFTLRDAGGFELVPHRAAAVGAEIEGVVVRRHRRDRAHQDRVVAVHQRVDADRGLEIAAAGVIAGPFAERPFLDLVVGMDEALEGDLRVRRHRQAGLRHVDDLDRLAEDAARGLELVLAVGNLDAAEHDQRRMHAGDHRDRTRLPALVVLAHDDQAVLAGRHHHRAQRSARATARDRCRSSPSRSPGPSSPRGRRCR